MRVKLGKRKKLHKKERLMNEHLWYAILLKTPEFQAAMDSYFRYGIATLEVLGVPLKPEDLQEKYEQRWIPGCNC